MRSFGSQTWSSVSESVIIVYAPPLPSADADKGILNYQQLDSLISAIPPHDTTVILGYFNAVTGSDRHGFESVIGNYGSGRT